MPPEGLAARKRAIAAENEQNVLAVLMAAGATGVRAGRDLGDLTGLPERTVRATVARLQDRMLVRRDNGSVWLTDAGRTEVGAGVPEMALAPALEAVIAYFPAEALRAYVRLQLSAVIARWHLAKMYEADWPGFVSVGATGTGKTSIAIVVCRVYGFDEVSAIKAAFRETPGSLVGRRVRDASSRSGYRVDRSPALSRPYLCIDEWSAAPREVQAAAAGMLFGRAVDDLEEERFEIRPIVYVTLNNRPGALRELHPEHVRRAVILDTTPLRPLLADLDRNMHRLLESGQVAIPRLSLSRLRPPVAALPDELFDLLRSELRAGLTDDGREHCHVGAVARIVLGRAALTDGPLEQATLTTVYDYLSCADTLGQARDGFTGRLAPRLGAGELLPDPDAARDQRQQLIAIKLNRELERTRARDQLVEDRGRLGQMLDEAIRKLDLRRLADCSPQQRVDARGLAERLREVRNDVTSARTRDALQAAETRAQDPLRRAGELLQHVDRERDTRRQINARTASFQRSRTPELEPTRTVAGLILALLPGADGAQLDELNHRSQQLERSSAGAKGPFRPVSETERGRAISNLQAKELYNAQRVNPWG